MLRVLVIALALVTSSKPMARRQTQKLTLGVEELSPPAQLDDASRRKALQAKLAAIDAELRGLDDEEDTEGSSTLAQVQNELRELGEIEGQDDEDDDNGHMRLDGSLQAAADTIVAADNVPFDPPHPDIADAAEYRDAADLVKRLGMDECASGPVGRSIEDEEKLLEPVYKKEYRKCAEQTCDVDNTVMDFTGGEPNKAQMNTLCKDLSCKPLIIAAGSDSSNFTFISQYKPQATKVVFPTASASKFIATIAIAGAVEDGSLGWDEKAADVFSWWNATDGRANVTLRKLLQFRGGFQPPVAMLETIRMECSRFAPRLVLQHSALPYVQLVDLKKLRGCEDKKPFEVKGATEGYFSTQAGSPASIADWTIEDCAKETYNKAHWFDEGFSERSPSSYRLYSLLHLFISFAMAVKKTNLTSETFLQKYLYEPYQMSNTKFYPLERPIVGGPGGVTTVDDMKNLFSNYLSRKHLSKATTDVMETPWTSHPDALINAMGHNAELKTIKFRKSSDLLGLEWDGATVVNVSGPMAKQGVKRGWKMHFINGEEATPASRDLLTSRKDLLTKEISFGTGVHYWKGSMLMAVDRISKTFQVISPPLSEYSEGSYKIYKPNRWKINKLFDSLSAPSPSGAAVSGG